jgi:hypothetical protein
MLPPPERASGTRTVSGNGLLSGGSGAGLSAIATHVTATATPPKATPTERECCHREQPVHRLDPPEVAAPRTPQHMASGVGDLLRA